MRTHRAHCIWEIARELPLHPTVSGMRRGCAGPHWRGRRSVWGGCVSNQSLLSRSYPKQESFIRATLANTVETDLPQKFILNEPFGLIYL